MGRDHDLGVFDQRQVRRGRFGLEDVDGFRGVPNGLGREPPACLLSCRVTAPVRAADPPSTNGSATEVVPDDHELLNAALTLSADHELAPATFATRVAASTGAHLHACVTAGLAALALATNDKAEKSNTTGINFIFVPRYREI